MPTRNAPRSPAPPRVAEHPGSEPAPLADGVSWSEVEAGPDQSFSGSVRDLEIVGSRLHGVRLTGAVIEGGRWVDAVLEDCELSATVLDDATLVRVLFHRCRMSSLIATGAKVQDARFVDCKIDGANFRASAFERCAFEDSDLTAADFYAARFVSGALRRCALADVEFSKATSDGLDLRGSRLEGMKGAGSLQGAVITSDQMVPFGIALLAALGVKVDDGDEPGPP